MNLIAAVDKNWGIGLNNALLVRIPDDMKRFRQITTGNVVVMGRKTLESFPGGQPLKNRTNIVITADREYRVKGAVCVHSMDELAAELEKYQSAEIYIIGGESIYRQLLDQCDTALITKIEYEYQADAWFPDLEQMQNWELTEQSEEQTYFDLEYYFCKYERKRI
ncbi:MAG: dihydrofolate reductase [Lachnospiraceae bacterium]|jgi:dihydrofolate reductase|nr:dihydrofolate reductase [Lachnospiraceae bacterium]